MSRVASSIVSVVLIAGCLAACVPAPQEISFATPKRPRGLTCDTATANVANFGRAHAKLYSEQALAQRLVELRGYMFNSGIRRIHLVQKANACDSDVHFAGLYQCTARAQLCGY
jgi:hypothetical protein